MLVKILSSAVYGVDAHPVMVEVSIDNGTGYCLTGMADDTIRESWHRLSIAVKSAGFQFPRTKITINLAPAALRKSGAAYDLPMAIGILSASNQVIATEGMSRAMVVGELGLDGHIYPIHGALSIAILALRRGLSRLILPEANAREAAIVKGLRVYGVPTLSETVALIQGLSSLKPTALNAREVFSHAQAKPGVDYGEVKGQVSVKRALEIAAAGGHNAVMVGPPGVGKTMLAQRLPTILPPLTLKEALESTKIYSATTSGGPIYGLISQRPFRQPHHTASDISLVGGGTYPQPGEISLAHNGVLFLDELPEFRRNALEALRQPLEEGKVTINRAVMTLDFPSRFTLLASMNPCPCGYRNHPTRKCSCSPAAIHKYLHKISGPLLDRIDLHIEVLPVSIEELSNDSRRGESSADIRKRVVRAREIQESRYKDSTIHANAQMASRELASYCNLEPHAKRWFLQKMEREQLSARAHDRILKVGRTIADLKGSDNIQLEHIAEALSYRILDRQQGMDPGTAKKANYSLTAIR